MQKLPIMKWNMQIYFNLLNQNHLLSFVWKENLYTSIRPGFTYWLSRLSEFDRIIWDDRIDVCLNVFTSFLVIAIITTGRSGSLLVAWVLWLLSLSILYEFCFALAPLGLFISLQEDGIIFEKIKDCRGIDMLWWFSTIFFAQFWG